MSKNKIYFASDFHLGLDVKHQTSAERERKIIRWLDVISQDAKALYLVGDVFDYWFEYRSTVPKGYVRFLGKLAAMRDSGIEIYFFTGNHDMWMFAYLEKELGIVTYRKPITQKIDGFQFMIGHGDGLGPNDNLYKGMKKVFSNRLAQRLFSIVHPTWALGLMRWFSYKDRRYPGEQEPYQDAEKEWLVAYVESAQSQNPIDYYIFGHRHLPIKYTLKSGKGTYYNLGEWMYASSYGVWDGKDFTLAFFESNHTQIFGNEHL